MNLLVWKVFHLLRVKWYRFALDIIRAAEGTLWRLYGSRCIKYVEGTRTTIIRHEKSVWLSALWDYFVVKHRRAIGL